MNVQRERKETFGPGVIVGGRYEVEGLLGEGGMATVYRARDIQLDRWVALKILDSRIFGDDDFNRARARFFREARAMAAIDSLNVVPIYDVGNDGPRLFMVEKLLEGIALGDLSRREPLSYNSIFRIINDVLAGLQAVHLSGLVHRDIKPSNVLVTRERAVLIDLGIALGDDDERLTGANLVIGTPEFMSPEHAIGAQPTPQSDLYSLGLLILYLCSGRRDLAESDTSIQRRIEGDEWLNPDLESVPAPLRQILRKALANNPRRRYGSALEMRAALMALPDLGVKPAGLRLVELAQRAATRR